MATVSTEALGLDTAPTYAAASAGGDKFTPSPTTFLHVVNGSGSAVTVTIAVEATADGLVITDPQVSVPAGEDRFIKPPDTRLIKDADGLASLTWSASTSVTFAALKV